MATYKDINSSVRIGGGLTLPAGSITLSNTITLDNATGKVTATSFAGNGSLLTNLSSAAMTDVLLLNGTRSMTGNLTLTGANQINLKDTGHYIRQQATGIDTTLLDGIRISGYQGVELVTTNSPSLLAVFRVAASKINSPLTVTTSVTSTTINATGNLQENGTNLSAKYVALAGGTMTAQLKITQSVNTPSLLLEGASTGWASGFWLNNTTATTGRKYGVYSGSDGSFHISDETGAAGRLTLNSAGHYDFSAGNLTTTGFVKGNSFYVGSTLVVETDAKIDWNKLKNTPATYAPSAHTHPISDITNLQTTLDGKAASVHTHVISDVTGLQTALDAKSDDGHTHAFSELTSKPTTVSGYGITDASVTGHIHDDRYYTETEMDTKLATKSDTTHTHAFSELTAKPTTLSGYGITDAATSTHNHDSVYFKLAGGTITGATTVNGLLTLKGQADSGSNTYGMISDVALSLEHPTAGGSSSIYFKSTQNAPSDFAYIKYQDTTGAAGSELGRLTIGIENDGGTDNIMLKGETFINSDNFSADATTIVTFQSNSVYKGKITNAGTLDLTGDITLGGTVDGVDIAAFKTAYDSHTHTFTSLTSKPTTLSGYGITDASAAGHTHAFSSLTSIPTTLSGYGITDAAPKVITSSGALPGFNTTGFTPLPIFGDELRFRKPKSIEYFDGTAWLDWAGINFDNLTDGRGTSQGSNIDFTHAKFRITYDVEAWNGAEFIYICGSYNAPSGTFLLEGTKDNWVTTNVRFPETNVLGAYWRYADISSIGDDNQLRLTFNFTGATAQSAAWWLTEIQLITARPGEQGSGWETWFPFSWDINKNMTTTGEMKALTFRNSSGTEVSYSDHLHDNRYYTESEIDTKLSTKSDTSHTHTFASLTSKPTTVAGYGITDASLVGHTHTFSELTSKPTTLSGYGITDAATSTHNHDAVYAKLSGSTITGAYRFSGSSYPYVDNPNSSGDNVALNWLNDKPRLRVGGSGASATATFEVQGVGDSVRMSLDNAGNAIFTGTTKATAFLVGATTVIESDAKVDWNKIKNTPATYVPSAHTHAISDVTNLQTTLDGKAAAVHTHLWADLTDKPSTFAPSAHTHTIADVTNLQTSLNAKLDATANAVSASKWATARTITLSTDASGSVSFDGSGNVTLAVTVADDSHDHTSLKKIDKRDVKPADTAVGYTRSYFTSKEGLTGTAGSDYQDLLVLNTYTDTSGGSVNALAFDKSQMTIVHYQAVQTATTWGTPKTLAYTDSSITGNAATATKWATARTLTLSGDVSGSVSLDGTADATLAVTVADDSHNHIISNVDGLQTALDSKVDKVTGKGLSTEDYTTAEKSKLAAITDDATKTAASTTNGNILIDGAETVVYTHPANHPATMITTDASNRFVADSDISNWNAKATTATATTTANGLMSSGDKSKLDGVSTGANKTTSSATNGSIKLDGVDTVVYTHPANHPASVITQDASNRFVTDTEKTTWNAKVPTSITVSAGSGLTGGGDLSASRTLSVSFAGNGSATTVARSDHNHDTTYLALAGGTVTGATTFNSTVSVGSTMDVTGVINSKAFDFRLGSGDQVSRGDSGVSRALVKNTGNVLAINYAGDFTGGVTVQGSGLESLGRIKGPNYFVGATEVIDVNAKIDWARLKSVPSTFTPSAHTHAWSDITSGKPTTVSGYGITDAITTAGGQTINGSLTTSGNVTVNANMYANALYQNWDGVPRNNLGNPTVTEMALFNQQFTNKTWFYDPSKITFEYTNDGTTWIDLAPSTNTIKDFVSGRNNTSINIPNACQQFRITIKNDGNYVFLNALYMYWSSNSHSTQVKIEKKSFDDTVTTWTSHTNATNKISAWPGHMYLPFSNIAFSQSTSQHGYVRIIFTPTWSSDPTYSTYPINLNGMEVWGGYPSGSRNIFSWDRDKNVSFPAALSSTSLTATNITASSSLLVGSNAVWHAGNLAKSEFAAAVHTHDDRYYTESEMDTKLGTKSDTGHTHAYSSLTSIPSTFAPSAHTHLWADLTDKPSTFAPSAHTHAWTEITSTPTTLNGYGITDAATASHNHDSTYLKLSGGTMTGALTMGTNSIVGNLAGYSLSLNGGATLSSVSNVTIWADSDDSSTTEYLSLKAGADEVKILSDGVTFTYKGNTIWHAGNFTPANKLDTTAPYLGLDATGNALYPRMLAKNNPGTDPNGWIRVSADTGGILPYSNTNSFLGTSTWKFKEIHGVTLYENGTSLASKYLGIAAKAADSDKLDGLDSTAFMRSVSTSYSAVTGDDGTDGWYTLFSVNDATNSPIQCNIKAYAHSSASFIVSKGYSSSNAMITVLNANTGSTNGSYKYLKGLRILADGTVQIKLNGGASVQIQAQLHGNGVDGAFASTLVKDTTAPTVAQTIDPLVNGSVVANGEMYSGSNKVWHAGNLTPGNYVTNNTNNQSTGTGFTVNGTMYAGSTSAGTNNGDIVVRGAGNATIHLDGDSSGSINSTVKSYISGTGDATFAGRVTTKNLTITDATAPLIPNLNAERLEGKRTWDFSVPDSNADIAGSGVIIGMRPRQGGVTGPDASVKIEAGTVYTSSGRRFDFTTDYTATVPAAYAQYDRWDIYYVRGPRDGSGNLDPVNEGIIGYAKGATDGLLPVIPTGSVPLVKILVPMNDTGGVTVKDGSTGETPNLYDIRQWRPVRFEAGNTFKVDGAIQSQNDITEAGSMLKDKYARLGFDNSFIGIQSINGRVAITSTGTLGGNPTGGNHYIKVTDGSATLSIDPNEVVSTADLYLKGANINLQGATTSVEGKLKAGNNAKTVTIPAGSTSVTWTHNYGVTTYAVNLTSNSFERHVRWNAKTANTISVEIDVASDQDILVDCILIGY